MAGLLTSIGFLVSLVLFRVSRRLLFSLFHFRSVYSYFRCVLISILSLKCICSIDAPVKLLLNGGLLQG